MLITDIINSILFFIYALVWNKIIKTIIFLLTGTHEIERILKKDFQSFSTYKILSN